MSRTEHDPTPSKTIRIPTPMWDAYRAVLARRGSNATTDIHQRIRETVQAHGTPDEIEQVRAGDRELEQRKRDRYRRAASTRARGHGG